MMEPAIEEIFKFKDRAFVCIERNGGDCTDFYFKKVEEVF